MAEANNMGDPQRERGPVAPLFLGPTWQMSQGSLPSAWPATRTGLDWPGRPHLTTGVSSPEVTSGITHPTSSAPKRCSHAFSDLQPNAGRKALLRAAPGTLHAGAGRVGAAEALCPASWSAPRGPGA